MSRNHPFGIFDLTAYYTGDCSVEQRRRMKDHLDACENCRRELAELDRQKVMFLSRYPFASAAIIPKQDNHRIQAAPWYRPLLYALAACMVAAVTAGFFLTQRAGGPSFRIKGESGIVIVAKNRDGKPEIRQSNRYHPGDTIQMLYSCDEDNRFMLFAVDESGRITRYFPAAGDSAAVLPKGCGLPLPHSIVLDDYLGKELYVAVFSKENRPVDEVQTAIEESFRRNPDPATLEIRLDEHYNDRVNVRRLLTIKTNKD